MIIYIDFSLFTDQNSFGCVSGNLQVVEVPQSGDSVSFLFPTNEVDINLPSTFSGFLTVTNRVISVGPSIHPISLSLSDVVVPTRENAIELVTYLEKGFGLLTDIYE